MYLEQILDSYARLTGSTARHYSELVSLEFGRKSNLENFVLKRCLLAVEPTLNTLQYALNEHFHVVFTLASLSLPRLVKVPEILFEKCRLLVEGNIWLFSLGNTWLEPPEGINDSICQALQMRPVETFFPDGGGTPLGRMFHPEKPLLLEDIISHVKNSLRIESLSVHGNLDSKIRNIFVYGGILDDDSVVSSIIASKVDLVIAGEISKTTRGFLQEWNLSWVEITTYMTGLLGLSKLRLLLSLQHPNVAFFLHEEDRK